MTDEQQAAIAIQQSVLLNQVVAHNLPTLSTVKNLPAFFPAVALTVPAIHSQVFKAESRYDSKGRRIPGNGLAATGAIIRRGRKVLIDVDKYAAWLSGGA